MSANQETIFESQRELQQLRQDAKIDGSNVEALNLLIQVRGRNLPDGGTRILNDLVTYAISIGIQFDQVTSQLPWEHTERRPVTSNIPDERRGSPADQQLLDHIRLPAQLALGALLSAAMLWYLQ
jgi:hypothetical protein